MWLPVRKHRYLPAQRASLHQPCRKDLLTKKPFPNPCLIRFAKKGGIERRRKEKRKGEREREKK